MNYNEFMLSLSPGEAKRLQKDPEALYNAIISTVDDTAINRAKADTESYRKVLKYIRGQHEWGFVKLNDKILTKLKLI